MMFTDCSVGGCWALRIRRRQPMMYEASYADKRGKHHEVLVKADGTGTKE